MEADCFQDLWHSIHGIISAQNQQNHEPTDIRTTLACVLETRLWSRVTQTAAGCFYQDLLNTDFWFEILGYLDTQT